MFSGTGYVIYYGGCRIIRHSKLQSEILLSTTEAEYIALSQAMRDTILLVALNGELAAVLPIIIEGENYIAPSLRIIIVAYN